MKNINRFWGFVVLFAALLSACDKIEAPYLQGTQNVDTDVEFDSIDNTTIYRKMLIEDFTAHQCSNCPEGHQVIHNLTDRYGDTLVAIAAHAGSQAVPGSGLFSYDFRTEESRTLATDFQVAVYPSAVVNRTPYNNRMAIHTREDWGTAVAQVDRSTTYAALQIIPQLKNGNLIAHTQTTALRDYASPVKLAIYITEDNIIKPQKNGNAIDTNYVHNHVLRASMNGTYGSFLVQTENEAERGLTQSTKYPLSYQISLEGKDWNPANCNVVAILFDATTKEVLQVEETPFIAHN